MCNFIVSLQDHNNQDYKCFRRNSIRKSKNFLNLSHAEVVNSETKLFKVYFVVSSGDYRHMPEITQHKQVPEKLACHFCDFVGNDPTQEIKVNENDDDD